MQYFLKLRFFILSIFGRVLVLSYSWSTLLCMLADITKPSIFLISTQCSSLKTGITSQYFIQSFPETLFLVISEALKNLMIFLNSSIEVLPCQPLLSTHDWHLYKRMVPASPTESSALLRSTFTALMPDL